MEIGEVLSKSWKIIWKHKILWIFGILSSCGSIGSTGSNNYTYTIEKPPPWLERLTTETDPNIWIGIGLLILCVVLVMIAVVTLISIIGRVGLVRGALQADLGTEKVSFGELFRGSLAYFWRVLGLTLLFFLGIFIVVALMIAFGAALAVVTLGIALICLIPLICVLIPAFGLVYILLDQATNALVIENTGILDGLQRGWAIIQKNFGVYVLMGLIVYVGIYFIGGTIISLPMILATLPLVFGNTLGDASGTSSWLISGLCFIMYLPVLLILYGILNSYASTSFTLTYLRLSAPKDQGLVPSEPTPGASLEPGPGSA